MASQHDLDLANQLGASFRADLNLALAAISQKQWGPSAPPTLLAYQDWMDTSGSNPKFKIYDGASHMVIAALDATNHLWLPVIGGGNGTIASATTTDLSTVDESGISITGTTTITGLGTVPKGQIKRLTFTAALTLTHNGTSLILPGAKNITTVAGDTCLAESLGSGNWRILSYTPSAGLPNAGLLAEATVASATTADIGAAASNIVKITGTTTITSLGSSASLNSPLYFIRFTGALTFTHNATSLILPGAVNITTADGDMAMAQYLGSGNWKVLSYTPVASKIASGLIAEATVASATTTNIGAAASNIVKITGTTTITGFGSGASLSSPLYFIRFTGALTLTHNATSLILPSSANITTADGDTATALYLGSGNWKIITYTPVSGNAILNNSLIKAWANFNGVATISIRASFNVTSLTDNGNGDTTINFTSSLPDANYALVGTTSNSAGGGAAASLALNTTTTPTASACRIVTAVGTGGNVRGTYNSVAFIR